MPRIPITKICKGCGKSFETSQSLQKYCSYKCAYSYRKPPKRRKGKYVECQICGKKIYLQPCHIGKTKYCSAKCMGLAKRKKQTLKCKVCGKVFEVAKSYTKYNKGHYCSRKCMGTARTISKKRSIDNLWAIVIKLKAGNKCEYCGKFIEKGLNAHHIFSRSNHSVRWDLDNGVALCPYHHILGNMSAHKAPLEFAEWLKEVRGEEWYERLKIKAKQVCKPDKQQITEELKEEELKISTGKQVIYIPGAASPRRSRH